MKSTYICPTLEVSEAHSAQMLAESLKISNTPVDGSKALAPEDESWNIWNDDAE